MQFSLLKLFNSNVLRKILFYIIKSERVFIPLVLMPKLKEPGKVSISKEKGSDSPVCYAKSCAPEKQRSEQNRR